MKEWKIRMETLPARCEICHQVDNFRPEENYCSRCNGLKRAYSFQPRSIDISDLRSNHYFASIFWPICFNDRDKAIFKFINLLSIPTALIFILYYNPFFLGSFLINVLLYAFMPVIALIYALFLIGLIGQCLLPIINYFGQIVHLTKSDYPGGAPRS
jgi:hypothetical protein